MKAAALTGSLTIPLYTLFLFSCSFSYIHVVVPINISGLGHAVRQFPKKTEFLKQGYFSREKKTVFLEYGDNAKANVFFQIFSTS